MENKDIYISLEQEEYHKNKANLLSTQVDLLNLIKHIQAIRKIRQEKTRLKAHLHAILESIQEDLENIQVALPKPKLPKKIRDKLNPPKMMQSITEQFEDIEQVDATIEQELLEIQAKLNALNTAR